MIEDNFHTEKIIKFYNLLRKYLLKGLRRKLCEKKNKINILYKT